MSTPLEIGSQSRDGLLEVADTRWDGNGTLFVTVRELIGGREGWVGGLPIRRMRTLARRALQHPETIRSAREVRRSYDGSSWRVTFAISRVSR